MNAIPVPAMAADAPRSRSLHGLLVLALAAAAAFTMLNSFGIVQGGAKAELGLSDTMLGLIQGVGAAVPLVLFSMPIGLLVDRGNRLRLAILLGLLWTAGTLATALAPNAAVLFVARMMAGIGATGALTASLSMAADFCRPEQRGRALLIVTIGKIAGQAGAFALPGWLLGFFLAQAPDFLGLAPWRSSHVALAVVSLVMIAPLLTLREPLRREVESASGAPLRIVAAELWARRAFLIPLFVGQTGVVMADASAGIWAAPVLTRSFGLQPADFAGWLGSVMLLTGLIGSVLGGFVADWGQKRGRGGLLIGAWIAAAFGVPAALFPIMPAELPFALLFGLLMLCGTVTGLIASVALTVLIPNELRGLCIGAFIAIAGLVGYGIAPPLVAEVSLLLGGEAMLGTALAIIGVVVGLISAAGFFEAMRRAPEHATSQIGLD